ncbi:hypothetical protein BVRB_019500 [Beta vulgaris subsp. vulgaris]|uniref:Uncharacterized protein n=1 Tax=Beta vulgaris subsp. vulgaris TaxID=3555 RepID=A0A0J7YLF4_BETVV|nr:hypothetical protein BVRB_019500 [Beta vulgaris subsp. vulgaris]
MKSSSSSSYSSRACIIIDPDNRKKPEIIGLTHHDTRQNYPVSIGTVGFPSLVPMSAKLNASFSSMLTPCTPCASKYSNKYKEHSHAYSRV